MTLPVLDGIAFDGPAQAPRSVAPPADDIPEIGSDAWLALNGRRCELIRKMFSGGLSPDEQREYDDIERRTQIVVDKAFPPSTRFDEELAAIRARLAAEGTEA